MDTKRFSTVACTAFLKILLMIFNIIFVALGIIFLVVGIYGIKSFKEFFTFAPSQAIYVPIICIGLFMSIVGVLSLWCTPKGVTWLLYMYSIVIFILFLAIFTLSILFMIRRDTFEATIKEGLSNSIKNYPSSKDSLDLVQNRLHCCGLNNYTDWFDTKWANNERNVPDSCCKLNLTHGCVHEKLESDVTDIYQQGCYKTMHDIIEERYLLIGGIGFAASIFIFLGTLLTCGLSHNLRKNRYEQVA